MAVTSINLDGEQTLAFEIICLNTLIFLRGSRIQFHFIFQESMQ